MANINFVPDDYIQKKDSRRANWMYLFLCLILIGALSGVFMIIKVREGVVNKQADIVAQKMAKAEQEITQFEQLQIKRRQMMKTALTAVELLEPVPRSIMLAILTNELPDGTSLTMVKLTEKKPRHSRVRNKKNNAKNAAAKVVEKALTFIEIEGIAPSDKEVATYIENLNSAVLFDEVDLVFTQEYSKDRKSSLKIRKFKLSTTLKSDIQLTKEDIDAIRLNPSG